MLLQPHKYPLTMECSSETTNEHISRMESSSEQYSGYPSTGMHDGRIDYLVDAAKVSLPNYPRERGSYCCTGGQIIMPPDLPIIKELKCYPNKLISETCDFDS